MDQVGRRGGLASIHRGADHGHRIGQGARVPRLCHRSARQIDALTVDIGQQANGDNNGRRLHIGMPGQRPRSDTARRHQMARRQIVRHLCLELVGGIAVAITHHNLIPGKQNRTAAVGQLQARMLSDLLYPRQHQITDVRHNMVSRQQCSGRLKVDMARRVRNLGAKNTFVAEGQYVHSKFLVNNRFMVRKIISRFINNFNPETATQ